ncbi:hypothetical protein QR680_012654 [Steinernema hermaphroditum]|uniref:Uncharacterized protein n=1 Tax=Steinernema hermaphroditum TaxID=289476 RepID=A0AA39I5H6_9BILA|nr:hypothetical protein QR680_012654 [Steinernema hermaphroditum]
MFRHPQATPSRGGMTMNQTVQYLKNRAKAPLEKGGMPIPGNGGRRAEAGGVVIQPVDEDEGIEYSAKRIAAARFERNHRLIAELFSSSVVADSRNVVMQHRMDTLKKQGNSLKLHQEKLEEELVRLEKVFNDKKRQLEKNSEEFAVNLKKVCDDKPQLDADKFNSMVDEWKGKLLDAYKEYQSNQEAIKKKQEAEKQQTPMLYSLVEESTPPPAPAPDAQSSEDATPDASRESTQKAASDEQMEVDGESANEAAEATSDEKASEESNYDSNNGKKAAVEDDPAEASPAEDTKADTTFVETGEKEGEGEEKTEEAAATDA